MNKFRSLLTVAFLSTSTIRMRAKARESLQMVSHVALTRGVNPNDGYEAMTVKALRKVLTARKVKGRSKLMRKADIIAKLRAL